MKASTKKAKAAKTYKSMHARMPTMTERELREAIKEVLNSDQPRIDLLARLTGRYNRKRSVRCMAGVMGLLSYRGKRDVDAVLDNHG